MRSSASGRTAGGGSTCSRSRAEADGRRRAHGTAGGAVRRDGLGHALREGGGRHLSPRRPFAARTGTAAAHRTGWVPVAAFAFSGFGLDYASRGRGTRSHRHGDAACLPDPLMLRSIHRRISSGLHFCLATGVGGFQLGQTVRNLRGHAGSQGEGFSIWGGGTADGRLASHLAQSAMRGRPSHLTG